MYRMKYMANFPLKTMWISRLRKLSSTGLVFPFLTAHWPLCQDYQIIRMADNRGNTWTIFHGGVPNSIIKDFIRQEYDTDKF